MGSTDIENVFARWVERADATLQEELTRMAEDAKARDDAFFRDLAFGTGGLRGLIGAGPNRMNVHTVARATQGLADYLNERFEAPSVAIARDSRHLGGEFVRIAAGVLAANEIASCAYPRVEPTPALSWAVRDLGCSAGICITASHNPGTYNGYKVYGADGCQITTQAARDIQERIAAVDTFGGVKPGAFEDAIESGMFSWIEDGVLDRYIDAVAALSPSGGTVNQSDLSITYTPLNGTGLECVERVLERAGIGRMDVVEEQRGPDGDFPTCPYPNPEVPGALELGLRDCKANRTDLLLATDPDADRVGVATLRDEEANSNHVEATTSTESVNEADTETARPGAPALHGGEALLLTGNEIGILLLDYICGALERRGEDLSDKVVITTIVSSPMADVIAQDRGFELRRTLTGFKFIGEQIGLLEAAGEAERFAFGFEESCGYLSGTHVRDKDAVNAALLVCEAASWHRAHGRDLAQAMQGIYERYGFFKEGLVSIDYPGADGAKAMSHIMRELRENPPQSVAGLAVKAVVDYAGSVPMPIAGSHDAGDGSPQHLPPADVLEFDLEGNCKLIVRPSGTEPKVKAYAMVRSASAVEADGLLATLKAAATQMLSNGAAV